MGIRYSDPPTLTRPVCDGRRTLEDYARLGWYWNRKAQLMRERSGTYQAARNLRKQGVPLKVALILLRRA